MFVWIFCQLALISASVIGIDYGTDWYKVSLIKPGPVIETVLNRESKRKTPALILIRDGIRYFGSDAAALGIRYPLTNYPTLKYVVGKDFDDKEAVEYRETWANNMVRDTKRGVVAFDYGNGTWSVEALIAMQFAHMKKMAESYGGEKVHGAVVTVPPYYGPFERQVILDAAELGGINVLSLMNDEISGTFF
jgi:hypoxia up-regulated 1